MLLRLQVEFIEIGAVALYDRLGQNNKIGENRN